MHENFLKHSDRFKLDEEFLETQIAQVTDSKQIYPEEGEAEELAKDVNSTKPIFSDAQVFQLHAQAAAFKDLLRGESIPLGLVKLTGGLTPNQWKAESERLYLETASVKSDD